MKRRRVVVVGSLLVAVLALGGVELVCFGVFTAYRERFSFLEVDQYLIGEDRLEWARTAHHPDYGWMVRWKTDHGERPREVEYDRPLMAFFGDSFTF